MVYHDLTQLAAVIEEEIAVGEELNRNLGEQRNAIIAWNVNTFQQRLGEREVWLRSLGELEKQRLQILERIGFADVTASLRQMLDTMPQGSPEVVRLRALQDQARKSFIGLQNGERALCELIKLFLAHIHEALRPLQRPSVTVYGGTGKTAPQRPVSALIRNRV